MIEKVTYDRDDNLFLVKVPFYEKELIKEIDGAEYNKTIQCWTIPMSITAYNKLKEFTDKMPEYITNEYERLKVKEKRIEESRLNDKAIIKMPIKLKPYIHQIKAFNMAMEVLEIL